MSAIITRERPTLDTISLIVEAVLEPRPESRHGFSVDKLL